MCFSPKNAAYQRFVLACKNDDIQYVEKSYLDIKHTPDPSFPHFKQFGVYGIFHALIHKSTQVIKFLAPFEFNTQTFQELTIPVIDQSSDYVKTVIFLSKLYDIETDDEFIVLPARSTPLMLAIILGQLDAVLLLLDSIGAVNTDLCTALDYAVYTRSQMLLQVLLETRILNLEFIHSKSVEIAISCGNHIILQYYNDVSESSDEFFIAYSLKVHKGKIAQKLKQQMLKIEQMGLLTEMGNYVKCSEQLMRFNAIVRRIGLGSSEKRDGSEDQIQGSLVIRRFTSVSAIPRQRSQISSQRSNLSHAESSDVLNLSDEIEEVKAEGTDSMEEHSVQDL
ncbi:Ankyrin repeat-containing protein [Spironucleus salmonicida]|uniref:Ankyrin repeat-containing protein n=1 Tax=Spironucleus salmonicida TaxID=348837 RepID=V6LVE4_9EUKA|nr:Ankyrin repeat-containing protein [Spironucleus salmonicida]|eukprot:EST44774.1 Ankyrin repeat-containing protein [Spironucleus salmonicida]